MTVIFYETTNNYHHHKIYEYVTPSLNDKDLFNHYTSLMNEKLECGAILSYEIETIQ